MQASQLRMQVLGPVAGAPLEITHPVDAVDVAEFLSKEASH